MKQKDLDQWYLKITDYSDRLLEDLETLKHWPERVKTMQKNWIGKSKGVEIVFEVENHDNINVYTTRPDTLFGATFVAIAAQHPLAKEAAKNNSEIKKFIDECQHIKVAEAELATMNKKGLDIGLKAIHPLTK